MSESGGVSQRRVCSTPASTIRAVAGAFEELSELLTDPDDALRLRCVVGWLTALEQAAESKRRKGERVETHIAHESAGRTYKATSADSTEAFLECAALEAMVRALEAGEPLEIGP